MCFILNKKLISWCMLKMEDLDDQVVPQLQRVKVSIYPKCWENQTNLVQTFLVKKHSEEWGHFVSRIQESLPNSVVHKIVRIQNKFLWDRYSLEKKLLELKTVKLTSNEIEVFHGSGSADPFNDIATSEHGFDMRQSKIGLWGRANYFSTTAKYSDSFCHKTFDTSNNRQVKELIIAYVLLGEILDLGRNTNNTLTLPPQKEVNSGSRPSTFNVTNLRYDSVAGITSDTRIYMTYDKHRAYPSYIVQYTTD